MNWLDHKVLRSPSQDSIKVVLHLFDRSMVVVVETTVEGGGSGGVVRWLVGDADWAV